nr:hypothetical protein [Tanacetum cinerariifolium]
MGDANPILTLGDYSKPSREGYRNTIELPVGNHVVPLRSDTIRLEADFKQQPSKMTSKIDTVLKAITDRLAGSHPSDTVKNPKLSTSSVLSARSYPTKTHNAQPISMVRSTLSQSILSNKASPIMTSQQRVRKKRRIARQILIPTLPHHLDHRERDDDDVMFIEIVKKDDDSRKEKPEAGGLEVEYFDTFLTRTNVSKPISILNEEFSDDATPSVAQKFLNEVKSTIVTLQRVVKQRMILDTHNWSSSAQQELHKIMKDEIFLIVNQVDARVQNFEIQFLKKAAKFVGDFKSLAKEADESHAKHKVLELEIERLLRAVVSQDIMPVVQNNFVDETSNLQTGLERTKERFENCIIKNENEYAKLWNDWYKKCEECKFDKDSYDKAYNDMHQKIERLQAQLGDLNGKSKDTSCVSDTLNPLSQKLENENVELEFQVLNYAKENAHL